MSNTSLSTIKLNVTSAAQFVESVQSESSYYVFAAKHTTYDVGSDQNIPQPTDTTDTSINIYNDMIFGKRIRSSDVSLAIPRYDWTSGTSYDMYDDTDSLLNTKSYYACVNVGSQTHVYKCLYNNNNSTSTVEPSGTDIYPFETPEDGYMWKYMCTSNSFYMDKFATASYMPVVPNQLVSANARAGSIEVIVVETPGVGYNNYLTDEFRAAEDINIGGNGYLYGLGSPAPSTDNFYNGCIIKMTSGTAKDEYRFITDYYIQNNQKIIVLDAPFTSVPQVTDSFEINPYVYVFDTGGQKQTNCIARAIINPLSSNSIAKVDILESGSGYRSAQVVVGQMYTSQIRQGVDSTATLVENTVSRTPLYSNAALRAVISPANGHGSDPLVELGAKFACVSTKFIENESPLTTENDYRVIGLIKDPLFANVTVALDPATTVGGLSASELLYQYTSSQIVGTVTTAASCTAITGVSTLFNQNLVVGDRVLISSGLANFVSNVASITTNTAIILDSNVSFTASGATISVIKKYTPFGYVSSIAPSEITLTNVSTTSISTTAGSLVGELSFCTTKLANVATPVTIQPDSRPANGFYTYTQLPKFIGIKTSIANFTADETVSQDSFISYTVPSAKYHSGNDTFMFVTNISNIFETSSSTISDGVISGGDSAAQFTVTSKYNGELVPDSGQIIYIDHLSPVTRANNQTEKISLTLEF